MPDRREKYTRYFPRDEKARQGLFIANDLTYGKAGALFWEAAAVLSGRPSMPWAEGKYAL